MLSQLFSGISVMSLIVLLLILLLRKLKQPYFIAYIAAGILLGPSVFNVIHEPEVILELGEIGIILLMFSIGSEIDLGYLTHNFYKPFSIVLVQIVLSFICMYLLGTYAGWNIITIILTTFIISLSSSAIVFQYLARTGEIKSRLGTITCGVLLMQDIVVVPMMIGLNLFAGGGISSFQLFKVCCGGVLLILFLKAAVHKKIFKLPMSKEITADHELQVFIGLGLCFGMAWISGWFGLSTALGAFVSGIFIGQSKATHWLGKALIPFRVFFMAFFFLAVGLQLHVTFFVKNLPMILLISLAVLLINSLLNAILFRAAENSWRDSIYAGALLSQIGEFSFVLMSMAFSLRLVEDFIYQITLAVITTTMLLTSIWLMIIQQLIYRFR
ncbi:cation:proton antiporter [Flavobacterium endoglycinae]|uniref:Cation:proton antiporter n=1 Tax=Flavobacterium endoglycinae TaxID=2816357 RepID=A0ABX7QE80_9FLAO|nr:cation:proton antiporter [Flavobacterium endoglycinae]